jgi:predicted LPLAT superfamily acyltransferase
MRGLFYRFLVGLANICGSWTFTLISRFIAGGYFLFSPRVAESCRFYRLLYPQKNALYHRWCTFKQYQNFTTLYFDRLSAKDRELSFTTRGWEHLEKVIGAQGGVVLMSHLGNWEVAAHLLQQQHDKLKLLLYMGVKEKEDIERIQKQSLRESGIKIIGVDRTGGSPFDVVEGIQYLKSGGLVSLTGDIVWRREQRTVMVKFLGRQALLPKAPYVFALVSGAPLFVFFTFKTGQSNYHFTVSRPIYIKPSSRSERGEAIRQAAQQYADLLEETLKQHPFEWYHFNRFLLKAE